MFLCVMDSSSVSATSASPSRADTFSHRRRHIKPNAIRKPPRRAETGRHRKPLPKPIRLPQTGRWRKSARYNSLPQWGKVSPKGTDEVFLCVMNSSSVSATLASPSRADTFSRRRRHIKPNAIRKPPRRRKPDAIRRARHNPPVQIRRTNLKKPLPFSLYCVIIVKRIDRM